MISVTQENIQNCQSNSSNNLDISAKDCNLTITGTKIVQTIMSNTECFLQTLQNSEIQNEIVNAILEMTTQMKSGLSVIFSGSNTANKKVMIKNSLSESVTQITKQDVKNVGNNKAHLHCTQHGNLVINDDFIYQVLSTTIVAKVTAQQWSKVFTDLQTQVTVKSLQKTVLFDLEGIIVLVIAILFILFLLIVLLAEA
jgi:hypothetical protein